MTLNNLAGGVAGGAVGVDASTAFIMAILASFCMMKIGHRVGLYLNTPVNEMNKKIVSYRVQSLLVWRLHNSHTASVILYMIDGGGVSCRFVRIWRGIDTLDQREIQERENRKISSWEWVML